MHPSMSSAARRAAVALVAWAAGATASVVIGLLAVSLISNRLQTGAPQPTVPREAAVPSRGITPAPPTTASPAAPVAAPSPHSASPTESSDQLVASSGGTALVHCGSDGAYLVSWSPRPGYQAATVNRGPGSVVQVAFTSDGGTVRLAVRCLDGVPQPARPFDPTSGWPTVGPRPGPGPGMPTYPPPPR